MKISAGQLQWLVVRTLNAIDAESKDVRVAAQRHELQ